MKYMPPFFVTLSKLYENLHSLFFVYLIIMVPFLGSPAKYNSPPGPTIVALVLSTLAIEPNGIDSPLLSLTVKSAFFQTLR